MLFLVMPDQAVKYEVNTIRNLNRCTASFAKMCLQYLHCYMTFHSVLIKPTKYVCTGHHTKYRLDKENKHCAGFWLSSLKTSQTMKASEMLNLVVNINNRVYIKHK